ncbi:MAG: ribonuclease Z [Rhabdochlamydiaceae bacterium]|nr:ribonuclease Z [Candidatus Amphrikana amoebophyrae]
MSVRDLVVLGTSAQQPTRHRNHGAYLLRWNGEGLLFDPGEGTQRQFIFADIAPPCVTRIFISHFHGDHCLGLGSMLMRLNLDKVNHPIHCYYPASGQKYFDRLRFGTMYHESIKVVEHPISQEGIIHKDDNFTIEARFMKHGVHNLAYKVTEPDELKFDKEKLKAAGIKGPIIKELIANKSVTIEGKPIKLEDVSWVRKGDSFVAILDTKICDAAFEIATGAKMLLCEATYLDEHKKLATQYLHMTAKQAAEIAQKGNVGKLILTHYSARYSSVEDHQAEAREVFAQSFAAEDLMRFELDK